MFVVIEKVPFVFDQISDDAYLKKLYQFCLSKEKSILNKKLTWENESDNPTTSRYGSYNFLDYKNPLVTKFKKVIKKACVEMFENLRIPRENLWILCWVNIHRNGQFLGKHTHQGCLMHGHLTVRTTNTFTVYGEKSNIICRNENGMVSVLGRERIPHYVTPYKENEGARVSIAFDIGRFTQEQVNRMNRMYRPFKM
jgi:hypothetical protein